MSPGFARNRQQCQHHTANECPQATYWLRDPAAEDPSGSRLVATTALSRLGSGAITPFIGGVSNIRSDAWYERAPESADSRDYL